jgi:hypothetical protein
MKESRLQLATLCLTILLTTLLTVHTKAQDSINYDESKVPPYTLPDPLILPNGKRITTAEQWTQQQRPAMLKLFAENVYGRMPGKPEQMHFIVNSIDSSALGGKAIRKQSNDFLYTRTIVSFNGTALIFTPLREGTCSCFHRFKF